MSNDAKKYFGELVNIVTNAPTLSAALEQVYDSAGTTLGSLTHREVRLTKCVMIAAIMQLDPSVRKSVKRATDKLKEAQRASAPQDFMEVLVSHDL